MPAVAAVTPPTSTAATTTRAAREMPRGPPARRKVNLIDATASFAQHPAATRYHVRGAVRGSPRSGMAPSGPEKDRSGRSSRGNRDRSGAFAVTAPRRGCAAPGCSLHFLVRLRAPGGSRGISVILPAGLGESGAVVAGSGACGTSDAPVPIQVGGVVEATDDPPPLDHHQPGDGAVVRGQEGERPGPAGQGQGLA